MSVGDAIVRVAEIVAETGPKTMDAFNRLFPGVAERSRANAASHEVHTVMSDMGSLVRVAEQMGLSSEMQVSFANLVFEKHGSDQRVAKCFEYAAAAIEEDGDPYGVDDEWLDYWRVHAGKARTEDMQAMWGAILAGEVNAAGSVSKRSMAALSNLSRYEAEALRDYCSKCVGFSVEGAKPSTVWPCFSAYSDDLNDPTSPLGVSNEHLVMLMMAGLIDGWPMRIQLDHDKPIAFIVDGVWYRITGKGESGEIPEESALFFQLNGVGQELSAFVEPEHASVSVDDLTAVLEKAGLAMERIEETE